MLSPIQIGPYILQSPVLLAPMAGVTDIPFRTMMYRLGTHYSVSEMIASAHLLREGNACERLGCIDGHIDGNSDIPYAVQIAGAEPDIMGDAARFAIDHGADIIDINFGCPAKTVTKQACGSALMQNPALCQEIMQSVIQAAGDVPVTIKMRLGWNDHQLNAREIACIGQDLGVQMVVIHARTRQQKYKGVARWHMAAEAMSALHIPAIINGDIGDVVSTKTALQESGANGVMIGRKAIDEPWVICNIINELNSLSDVISQERIGVVFQQYYADLISYYGAKRAVMKARKFLSSFLRHYPEIRATIVLETQASEVQAYLRDFDWANWVMPQHAQHTQHSVSEQSNSLQDVA